MQEDENVSGEQRVVRIEDHTTTLSLAVKLVDAYTDERPVSEYRTPLASTDGRRQQSDGSLHGREMVVRYPLVSIAGINAEPVENPSGYHLFLDLTLPDTPVVTVDGGTRYMDATHEVELSALSPLNPVAEIELTPSRAYQFPAGATLLRGCVQDADETAVAGATLSIQDIDRTTETDRDGEFVLYFTHITTEDIRVVNGRRMIQIHGRTPHIEVSHDVLGSGTVRLAAEESTTRSYVISYDDGGVTARESIPE